MKRISLPLLLISIVLSCTTSSSDGGKTASLVELTDFAQLTSAFDSAQGVPRMVLLLSPT